MLLTTGLEFSELLVDTQKLLKTSKSIRFRYGSWPSTVRPSTLFGAETEVDDPGEESGVFFPEVAASAFE